MASILEANLSITTKINEYLATSKEKSYFITAVTVIFTLIVLVFGIRPAVTAAVRQYNDNQLRDDAIEQLETKISSLESLVAQQNQARETINYLNFVLPRENRQDYFIDTVFEIADSEFVTISNITFEDNEEFSPAQAGILTDPSIVGQEVSISLTGSLENIISFAEEIESSRRPMLINTMNINPIVIDENTTNERLTFSSNIILVYFYSNL